MRLVIALTAAVTMAACGNIREPRVVVDGGDAERGQVLLRRYGCAACHTIPGVPGANSHVGPPLGGVADRGYIGGVLPNTPDAMIRWIQNPQAATPRTIMPALDVTEEDARDMAAYLYTLRARGVLVRLVRGFAERATGRTIRTPSAVPPGSTPPGGTP